VPLKPKLGWVSLLRGSGVGREVNKIHFIGYKVANEKLEKFGHA
jgi:hypothetical protein